MVIDGFIIGGIVCDEAYLNVWGIPIYDISCGLVAEKINTN